LDVGAWTGSVWLRTAAGAGSFECGNEPSGSLRCGEFLDYLKNCHLRRKAFTPGINGMSRERYTGNKNEARNNTPILVATFQGNKLLGKQGNWLNLLGRKEKSNSERNWI
jgi:hypothetical protein